MTATATAFTFETASFLDALTAAALASLAADMRAAQLVEWWKAGDMHRAAAAYVSDYFAKGGETVEILNSKESTDSCAECFALDVAFVLPGGGSEGWQPFTVWLEDVGHGPFIYGEW